MQNIKLHHMHFMPKPKNVISLLYLKIDILKPLKRETEVVLSFEKINNIGLVKVNEHWLLNFVYLARAARATRWKKFIYKDCE